MEGSAILIEDPMKGMIKAPKVVTIKAVFLLTASSIVMLFQKGIGEAKCFPILMNQQSCSDTP
jgi:hypothetical protein